MSNHVTKSLIENKKMIKMRRLFWVVKEEIIRTGFRLKKGSGEVIASLCWHSACLYLSIKNIFIYQKSILIFLFFCFSLFSTSLLSPFRGLLSIVLINNLHKSITSKDLNCSMSPSLISLILLRPEN
jgi:hypothetical protein